MSGSILLRAVLALLYGFACVADATPVLNFPVNSQVPPVARVSQPYTFVFSESTFISSLGTIQYQLEGEPSWLEIDGASRTLSGTPDPGDLGASVFHLVATDKDGSAMASVTMVIIESAGPELDLPLLPQLDSVGRTSSPASLLLYPLQAFSWTFSLNTFQGVTSSTNFYAISADSSPLPSWIQFDAITLGFSGTTPPLVSPSASPQTYGIKLIASDVAGFSQAVAGFEIVIGYHILSFNSARQFVNLTAGQAFFTVSLLHGLILDGIPAASPQLASVTSTAPGWVHLDAERLILSGTAPEDASDTDVLITVTDVFGDTAILPVTLSIARNTTQLFLGHVPSANATAGDYFSYSIKSYIEQSEHVDVTVDLGNSSSWLTFNKTILTISGVVPANQPPGVEGINVFASAGIMIQEQSFDLYIGVRHAPSTTLLATSVQSSSTSQSTFTYGPPTSAQAAHVQVDRTLIIVLATTIPVIFLAILACLLSCCARRRHNRQQKQSHLRSQQSTTSVATEDPTLGSIDSRPLRIATSAGQLRRGSTTAEPPKIELPWAPDSLRISRNRVSRRLRLKPQSSTDSSWGGFIVSDLSVHDSVTKDPVNVPQVPKGAPRDIENIEYSTTNFSRKMPVQQTMQPRKQERRSGRASKALSGTSNISTGLPTRLSAAGHGSGGYGPAGHGDNRSSWQTILGSIPSVNSPPATVVLDSFPVPPREVASVGRTLKGSTSTHEATVRLVRNDSYSPLGTLEAQRQKFHTDRARDRLEGAERFSSAWAAKAQSSSRILIDATRSPGRTIDTQRRSDGGLDRRTTQHSWSQWSGIRPTTQAESALNVRSPGGPTLCGPSRLKREESAASSGQFDSAASSGTQWEDEKLEEANDGTRRWQKPGKSSDGETASPRLPFESISAPQENVEASDLLVPRALRLADYRRPVSVDKGGLQRTERSYRGSLRFI